ncbi:MAG: STAS domain-containing protein [Planctomycetes bacterium]|nr:STAS domain-containing protein [Planctomycetota bacterium]
MPSLMSQSHGKVLVIYFTEAKILEEATLQGIGRELMEFAARCDSQQMLLNFENVKFMSSAMLGKLVQLNKKCKEDKIDLKLCSIAESLMEVFKLTRLNKILDIHSDEERALKAFGSKGFFV